MTIFKYFFPVFFIYAHIKLTNSEVLPFLIHADQVFLKCSDGTLESFNSTTNILSTCIQTTHIARFNLFQLFIQCPDGRLHLEYNRTFTSEYSMTSFQPYCFIGRANEYHNPNQLVPYQTRYTSDNGTFTQIISFQCQYNLSMTTNEQFYLYFKLMNYGFCRYAIQFMYSDGKCNRFYQQIYKIQAQIKHSICYDQLGFHPLEISLDYFDQLPSTNLSLNKHSLDSIKSVNRTVIIMTASITCVSLFLCLGIFIAMHQFGLFRS